MCEITLLTTTSCFVHPPPQDYCTDLLFYFPATNLTDCSTYDGLFPGTEPIQV
jgi:hypothetical protein